MIDYKWSNVEKAVCRKAFDTALQAELASTISEFRAMAAVTTTPDAMWTIEEFLTEKRQEIDRKYDYRYSQLIRVFGRLLREGRITEDQLHGLADEKLAQIRQIASF
jgi:hypothetical protein